MPPSTSRVTASRRASSPSPMRIFPCRSRMTTSPTCALDDLHGGLLPGCKCLRKARTLAQGPIGVNQRPSPDVASPPRRVLACPTDGLPGTPPRPGRGRRPPRRPARRRRAAHPPGRGPGRPARPRPDHPAGRSPPIRARAARAGPRPRGCRIAAVRRRDREREAALRAYLERAAPRGVTPTRPRAHLAIPLLWAALQVTPGRFDGFVAGAPRPPPPAPCAPPCAGSACGPGSSRISSFMLMLTPRPRWAMTASSSSRTAASTPIPRRRELAEIALLTAESARAFLRVPPRVALLSFSTRGSADHPRARKVAEAARIVKARRPTCCADGELQARRGAGARGGAQGKATGQPARRAGQRARLPRPRRGQHRLQAGGAAGRGAGAGPASCRVSPSPRTTSRGAARWTTSWTSSPSRPCRPRRATRRGRAPEATPADRPATGPGDERPRARRSRSYAAGSTLCSRRAVPVSA